MIEGSQIDWAGHGNQVVYPITPTFATTNHSGTMVLVFSYGPGAENFIGVYENTEIFHKLVLLLDTD